MWFIYRTFVDMLQVIYDLWWMWVAGIRGRGNSVMCTSSKVMFLSVHREILCSNSIAQSISFVVELVMYFNVPFYLQPGHKSCIVFAALFSFRTFPIIPGCRWQWWSHPVCRSVFQNGKWNNNPCWVRFVQNMKVSITYGAFLDSL